MTSHHCVCEAQSENKPNVTPRFRVRYLRFSQCRKSISYVQGYLLCGTQRWMRNSQSLQCSRRNKTCTQITLRESGIICYIMWTMGSAMKFWELVEARFPKVRDLSQALKWSSAGHQRGEGEEGRHSEKRE